MFFELILAVDADQITIRFRRKQATVSAEENARDKQKDYLIEKTITL